MDTPLDKKLIGDQNKLPEDLKAKIEAAPESPAKFLGGLSAAVGSLGGGSGDGSGGNALGPMGGGFAGFADIARRLAARNKQRNLPNGVQNGRLGQIAPGGLESDLNPLEGQKFELTPVQMKNEGYIPGNERGSAKPLFTDKAKKVADSIFGKQVPGTFDSALAKKNCNKKY